MKRTEGRDITLQTAVSGFHGLTRWREAAKLWVRACRQRRLTAHWLTVLNAQPLLQALAHTRPRLIYKIYRPYFSNTLNRHERVALLSSHYQIVLQRGLGKLLLRAAHAAIVVEHFAGKGEAQYHFELDTIEPLEREGELILGLFRNGYRIYTAAFTLFEDGGRVVLGIGCLQGPAHADGLTLIRDATRELYGMRPKQLMLQLLCSLGYAWQCHALLLVGNVNRVVHRAIRQGKVHADYDAFWRERGARLRDDGNFELVCDMLGALDLSDTASSKRAAARRRHELCSRLEQRILSQLAPLQPLRQPADEKLSCC